MMMCSVYITRQGHKSNSPVEGAPPAKSSPDPGWPLPPSLLLRLSASGSTMRRLWLLLRSLSLKFSPDASAAST
jgi:hypothetical protein